MAETLADICEGPNYFEFTDCDCSSSDGNTDVYHIGTPEDQARSRMDYAIEQFKEWAGGTLAPDVMEGAIAHLRALPLRIGA